jgi:Zn-dependent peptidase ImmA (M78 family)
MSTIAVNREIIQWARTRAERSGLTIDALVKRFPKFLAWESGDVQPTLSQLELLARKTFTPLGYFFLQTPPDDRLPIPDFRTVGDREIHYPSPNLLETVQTMQRRQSWMHDFLVEELEEPLSFVATITLSTEIVEAATRIRQALGLEDGWARRQSTWQDALNIFRENIEQAGILVVASSVVGNNNHRKLDVNEFRGFVLNDNYAPLIFINAADYKSANMFTLAHEVVHVWLGEGGVFNLNFRTLESDDNEIERYCNKVAAELLVPEQELRALWPDTQQREEPFQFIARRFKVSPLVAARRALDLGFITHEEFFAFFEAYRIDERRKKDKKSDGGDFYNTQNVRIGKRFASAVIRATKESRLLYRDAYQLTNLYGTTFDKYAKSLGFTIGT